MQPIVGMFSIKCTEGEVLSTFNYIGIFRAVHSSQSEACTVLCTVLYNTDNNNMKDVCLLILGIFKVQNWDIGDIQDIQEHIGHIGEIHEHIGHIQVLATLGFWGHWGDWRHSSGHWAHSDLATLGLWVHWAHWGDS